MNLLQLLEQISLRPPETPEKAYLRARKRQQVESTNAWLTEMPPLFSRADMQRQFSITKGGAQYRINTAIEAKLIAQVKSSRSPMQWKKL